MKRYLDFRGEDWIERTDSHMQAARWAACVEGLGSLPPQPGVIDTYPEELLAELLSEGWVAMDQPPEDADLRQAIREAVNATLADDADCLAPEEHTLLERMLIGDGSAALETVGEMEAAYTLRMRLWCDLGIEGDDAVARLDAQLMEALPPLLMRKEHLDRRGRIFIYDGMMHGMLYMAGFLDDRMPRAQFIQEVLSDASTPQTERLARNYLEASFDTYALGGCNLLVHEALADPEALAPMLAAYGAFQTPAVTPSLLAASMNGLLPEESEPDEKLQRALYGALRPEYDTGDVATDLRFLAKQDAPMGTMQEIMAAMLCVLPTQHMDGALHELRHSTPRWINTGMTKPPAGTDGVLGRLH